MALEENPGNVNEDLTEEFDDDPQDFTQPAAQSADLSALNRKFTRLEKIIHDQQEALALSEAQRLTLEKKLASREAEVKLNPSGPTGTGAGVSSGLADLKTLSEIMISLSKSNKETFEAGMKAERTLQARISQEMARNVGAPLDDLRDEIEGIYDRLEEAAQSKGSIDPELIKTALGAAENLLGKITKGS